MGAAFGQAPPEGWLQALEVTWLTVTLSVVPVTELAGAPISSCTVRVQVTVAVKPDRFPVKAGLVEAAQLFDRKDWYAAHSIPARAAW